MQILYIEFGEIRKKLEGKKKKSIALIIKHLTAPLANQPSQLSQLHQSQL